MRVREVSSVIQYQSVNLTFHNFVYSLCSWQRVFLQVCCKARDVPLVVCNKVDGTPCLVSDRYSDDTPPKIDRVNYHATDTKYQAMASGRLCVCFFSAACCTAQCSRAPLLSMHGRLLTKASAGSQLLRRLVLKKSPQTPNHNTVRCE